MARNRPMPPAHPVTANKPAKPATTKPAVVKPKRGADQQAASSRRTPAARSQGPQVTVVPAKPRDVEELEKELHIPAKPVGSGARIEVYVEPERKIALMAPGGEPTEIKVNPSTATQPAASSAPDPAGAAIAQTTDLTTLVDQLGGLSDQVKSAYESLGTQLPGIIGDAFNQLRDQPASTIQSATIEAQNLAADLNVLLALHAEKSLASTSGDNERLQKVSHYVSVAENAIEARLRALRSGATFALNMNARKALVTVSNVVLRVAGAALGAISGVVLPPITSITLD